MGIWMCMLFLMLCYAGLTTAEPWSMEEDLTIRSWAEIPTCTNILSHDRRRIGERSLYNNENLNDNKKLNDFKN
jgi:hypothetical protein